MFEIHYRKDVYKILTEDKKKNEKLLNEKKSQLNRRNYLRSLFALYEADLYLLKQKVAILILMKWELTYTQYLHEIFPLLDDQVNINDHGKLKFQYNRQPFINVVAYCLKKFAEITEYKEDILSNHGWQQFTDSVKYRNRIMHPNLESEINISDEELLKIKKGEIWWDEIIIILNKSYKIWNTKLGERDDSEFIERFGFKKQQDSPK